MRGQVQPHSILAQHVSLLELPSEWPADESVRKLLCCTTTVTNGQAIHDDVMMGAIAL